MSSVTGTHVYYREPNYERRRYWGMLTLLSILLISAGIFVSISAGIHPERNGAFSVVPRKPYEHAYNPIALAELGLPPNSSEAKALPASPAVRAIVIRPGYISIMSAGKETGRIKHSKASLNLNDVVSAVNNKDLIEEVSSGHVVLKVALIVRNISLAIGSPYVSELDLVDTSSVFVGTESGTLLFDSVSVKSVSSNKSATDYYQPFVMATDNATMNATNSVFSGLGWDWNASYGVSWVEGSTGNAIGCTFEDSFIGAYTSRATKMTFKNDIFRNNALYGLDPHTYSSYLTIDNVLAENNKAHGIIFSDHVTKSTIVNSTSKNNGENGIMMDELSTSNVISNNTITGNTGDGLVTSNSPSNVFNDNVVSNNRVGVRLDPRDNPKTVTNNKVTNNGLASEGITLDNSNTSLDNGGQWNWTVVKTTWYVVTGLILLAAVMLAIASYRRKRRPQKPHLTMVR